MEDIINKKKEGSPVGEPSDNTKDTITDSTEDNTKRNIERTTENNTKESTEDSTNDDEITKKIKELLSSELASFKNEFTSTITELQDSSEALKQEKYKMEVEKFHAICKLIDEWGDLIDDDILNNGYICYSDKEKKVPKEIEEKIKNDTGSIRAVSYTHLTLPTIA